MRLIFRVTGLDRQIVSLKEQETRVRRANKAWASVAQLLRQEALECFRREASPSGVPWQPLSEATRWGRALRRTASYRARLKRPATHSKRVQRHAANARILQDTGRLRASVAMESDERSARIGSTLVYARTHQLGLRKKGIPARPFLGVSPAGRLRIREVLRQHYSKWG